MSAAQRAIEAMQAASDAAVKKLREAGEPFYEMHRTTSGVEVTYGGEIVARFYFGSTGEAEYRACGYVVGSNLAATVKVKA